MNPPLKSVAAVDFAVIGAYMLLMVGIGVYAMRFNRGASDYFKGGNRIHWLAAGLSSFMSGFSAWTFTGAAGLAYQHGLVAILLYVGNAATFLLGYFLFAQRWRRARIGTVMEYLVDRYDERTRQVFSWTTIFFQLFTGAAMLYGLAVFVAPACGWPISVDDPRLRRGHPRLLRRRRAVGGRDHRLPAGRDPDAVHARDAVRRRWRRSGGLSGAARRAAGRVDLARARPRLRLDLRRVLVGDDERRLQHRGDGPALLQRRGRARGAARSPSSASRCSWSAPSSGSCRRSRCACCTPTSTAIWPGLVEPARVLVRARRPDAAAERARRDHARRDVQRHDVEPVGRPEPARLDHLARHRPDAVPAAHGRGRTTLRVAWAATFGVGVAITAIALTMAAAGASVFASMVTFNTVMSLAYGPPALLGLVVKKHAVGGRGSPRSRSRSPSAASAASASAGASSTNVLTVVPASVAVFFLSALVPEARRERTRRPRGRSSAGSTRRSTWRPRSTAGTTPRPRSSAS